MDEPFAALDAITRAELQQDLLSLCQSQSTSVLFVTHAVDEAVYLADRVVVRWIVYLQRIAALYARGRLTVRPLQAEQMPPEIREGNVRKVAQPGETIKPSGPSAKGGSVSGGTQTTVKLTSTPKERYTQRVTQAVEKKWRIYLKLQMEGVTYGSLKVNFYVNKQGKVEDPLVVDDKDSYRALTLLTLRAIKDAEIPPMPVDVFPLLPMNDPERLKIEYNVLIY